MSDDTHINDPNLDLETIRTYAQRGADREQRTCLILYNPRGGYWWGMEGSISEQTLAVNSFVDEVHPGTGT